MKQTKMTSLYLSPNFKLMGKEEQSLPPLHGHKKILCFKGRARNKNISAYVRAGGNSPYPRIQALLMGVAYSETEGYQILGLKILCQFKVEVLVTQSCPALCDHMDCSPPNSSVQ